MKKKQSKFSKLIRNKKVLEYAITLAIGVVIVTYLYSCSTMTKKAVEKCVKRGNSETYCERKLG